MRHTFVIHLTVDTGDIDPQELMGEVEAFVIDAGTGLIEDPHVAVVDAWEADTPSPAVEHGRVTPGAVQQLLNRGVLEHVGWLTPDPHHPDSSPGMFCWPSYPGETSRTMRAVYSVVEPAGPTRYRMRYHRDGRTREMTGGDRETLEIIAGHLSAGDAGIELGEIEPVDDDPEAEPEGRS